MKAVVYEGINDLRVRNVVEARIEDGRDALIKVTTSAICASDIHIKRSGLHEAGKVIGHEYCGVVVEAGSRVWNFREGDRVVGQAYFHCGHCFYCLRRQPELCESRGIFGHKGNHGVQAEYARIPFADNTLRKIPDGLADEAVIFTGDILSTGFTGVLRTGISAGDTLAIFGAGPVGLCAVACAQLFGASLVICVDVIEYRLDAARKLGAIAINAVKENPVDLIKQLTDGRGVDGGIEAGGVEATFRTCMQGTRRGGKVCVLGVFGHPVLFDITERASEQFAMRITLGELSHMQRLLDLIMRDKLNLLSLITHQMSLSEAMTGYKIFEERLDGCIKVILKP